MSYFLFQKEQINCSCFDNSPKNAPRIFRTQSYNSNKNNSKENKQTSLRNNSEQGKQKKRSLKKQKQFSNFGSQKDPKEKQQLSNTINIPDVQTAFSSNQLKKQQKIIMFEQHYNQSQFMPIKSQRTKPVHNWRAPKPHVLFEPLEFQFNYKKQPDTPLMTYSQRKINYQQQYDKKISEQFQKDLRDFKLQMQNLQNKNVQLKHSQKKRRDSTLGVKNQLEKLNLNNFQNQNRYSATQHIIPSFQHQKSTSRAITFRNSSVSNRQKTSIKKEKNKILPKQIQSEKDSNSQDSSDRLSQVVGRGWDGLTQKRISLYEVDQYEKIQKTRMETMATQQSHIKSSQVNTFTGFSNIMTSPKSMNNKAMAFGGGHKYGLSGLSFNQVDNFKSVKGISSSKMIL